MEKLRTQCLLKLLLVANILITPGLSSCSNGIWQDAFNPDKCYIVNGKMNVLCVAKSGAACGMRVVAANKYIGLGLFSARVQAAPGPGAATTFYLSTNAGSDEDKGQPWNEIDFEILGKQCSSTETKIWTNYFTGQGTEHHWTITVPFDACAAIHTYTFDIKEDSIDWVVDGLVHRHEKIDAWDMKDSIKHYHFRPYLSLWGRSWNDPTSTPTGFWDFMGVLDQNYNAFPLQAWFDTEFNPKPPSTTTLTITTVTVTTSTSTLTTSTSTMTSSTSTLTTITTTTTLPLVIKMLKDSHDHKPVLFWSLVGSTAAIVPVTVAATVWQVVKRRRYQELSNPQPLMT